MRWTRWTRSDELGLEALLYVVVGLATVSVLPRVVAAARDEPITITTDLPEALVRPAEGVVAPLTGTVVLDDPSPGQHLLALLAPVLVVVVLAVGVALLLGVVRALGDGDPFTHGSARRLTWLALLVMGGGVVVQVVDDVTRNAPLSDVAALDEHLARTFTLPLWPLAAGLLLAFLAEVFARGTALRTDVEGLV